MALQQVTIAKELGISAGRVTQLKRRGMPVNSVEAARRWYEINVQARPAWKAKAAASEKNEKPEGESSSSEVFAALNKARAERERSEANMAAMKEAQMAGSLVDVEQVRKLLTDAGSQIRLALERIPDKLAPRLVPESDERTIHQLLDTEIQAVLVDLARVQL